MEGAYFGKAKSEGAYFGKAKLEGAYFGRAKLEGNILEKPNWIGHILSKIHRENCCKLSVSAQKAETVSLGDTDASLLYLDLQSMTRQLAV